MPRQLPQSPAAQQHDRADPRHFVTWCLQSPARRSKIGKPGANRLLVVNRNCSCHATKGCVYHRGVCSSPAESDPEPFSTMYQHHGKWAFVQIACGPCNFFISGIEGDLTRANLPRCPEACTSWVQGCLCAAGLMHES